MSVKLENNIVELKDALEAAAIAYLYEAGETLEGTTKRNSRPFKRGRYDVKNSWKRVVDEDKKVCTVGSSLEAAFWEELGTGEHALNKDGRKGWWVYIEGGSNHKGKTKSYDTKEEAEAAAEFLRKVKKLDAHATDGMEPNRPLHRAFQRRKAWLRRRAAELLGEHLE